MLLPLDGAYWFLIYFLRFPFRDVRDWQSQKKLKSCGTSIKVYEMDFFLASRVDFKFFIEVLLRVVVEYMKS